MRARVFVFFLFVIASGVDLLQVHGARLHMLHPPRSFKSAIFKETLCFGTCLPKQK